MFMAKTNDSFARLGFNIGDRVACRESGSRFYAFITGFEENQSGEIFVNIKSQDPFYSPKVSIEKIWKTNPLKGID